MIAIINRLGPADGVCTYTVQINKEIIATFDHDRRDGLEVCLRKAADAVRNERAVEIVAEWLKEYKVH